MVEFSEGSAHGRFQPLHNDHVEYLLAAKYQCNFLWIGITQYDIRNLGRSPADKHRETAENNPLTYFERVDIITEALVEAGVSRDSFGFVPFPIEQPDRLPDFLPVTVPCFTTVYDKWNEHKVKQLQDVGYRTIVLWKRSKKGVEGSQIRELIRLGDNSWISLVPPATARAVELYSLRNRLIELHEGGLRPT